MTIKQLEGRLVQILVDIAWMEDMGKKGTAAYRRRKKEADTVLRRIEAVSSR